MYYNTHNIIYIILEYKSYNNIPKHLCRFTNNMYYSTHNTIYIILEYKSYNNIQNISVDSLITCITIHTTQYT